MINLYEEKEKCCGCAVCSSICPQNAITMAEDDKGFVFPQIIEEKCIKCGKCEKYCPHKHEKKLYFPIKSWAAVNTDKMQLEESTSGGMFSALATEFVKNGGYVCGAQIEFENNLAKVKHVVVHSEQELKKLQKSKYIQSDTNEIYDVLQECLKKGEKVLFSGTPCQVEAAKTIALKNQENLYTIDIICHGVPNNKFFNEYIKQEGKSRNLNIESFSFREKKYGWGLKGNISGKDKAGKKINDTVDPDMSSYYRYFLSGEIYRDSCYQCPYAQEKRAGDITIGDYWGIEKYNPELLAENGGTLDMKKGVSCLLVNTTKGEQLLNDYGKMIEKYPVQFSDISKVNTQLKHPASHTRLREKIFKVYAEKGYAGVESLFEQDYKKRVFVKKVKHIIKSLLPQSVISFIKKK